MIEWINSQMADFAEYLPQLWIALSIAAGGWLAARILAAITRRLLRKTDRSQRLAARLGIESLEIFNQRLVRAVYLLVFLTALWLALRTLLQIPPIGLLVDESIALLTRIFSLGWVNFLVNLTLTILAALVLMRAVRWTNLAFERAAAIVESWRGARIRDIQVQQLRLLTADRLTDLLLLVVRYGRLGVILILGFVYLAVVFSFFPQTRGVVSGILETALAAVTRGWLSFVAYLPNLVNLMILVVVTRYGLRFLGFLFNEIEKGTISITGFYAEWAAPTFQLVRVLVIVLALVVAFPFLPGSASPAFQGISIFVGALFSLGSSSVVANIVSGVVLTYTRAFKVGDRVKIADTTGDVVERTLLVTRVRTIKNVEITIPNGMVLGSHIVNYSAAAADHGLILNTSITLGYDAPWRLVHQTLIEAAKATDKILKEPPPFVFQTSLDDFYVSYELNAYTDEPDKMAAIYSELHQNIQDKCNEAGIEILSPHYSALRDGQHSTIPAEHLPKDYAAPPFRVKHSPED